MAESKLSTDRGPTGTKLYAAQLPPSEALAHTLAEASDATATSVDGVMRSTVLPRIEHVEGSRRVVLDGRPRYEELARLGGGGQAHVVLARDHDIDRKVAVKRLKPETADERAIMRFAEEVRAIGQLEHPNIVPIHDVGIDHSGNYFYVMKHVEGETLESIIAKLRAGDAAYRARYTPEYRMQICYEVLRGVEHAHAFGILHRDLKPANLMVGKLGEVLVMDWGLAKGFVATEPALPARASSSDAGQRGRLFEKQDGAILGTPAYMSPEQAAGSFDSLDARSDIYSLALVFYELFSLQHPRRQHTTLAEMLASVVSEQIPRSRLLGDFGGAGAPAALAHFVWHGLAQDPARRYPSVTAMRARLDAVRDGRSPIECQITFVKSALDAVSHGVDRHPLATTVTLVSVILALVACIGALLWIGLR